MTDSLRVKGAWMTAVVALFLLLLSAVLLTSAPYPADPNWLEAQVKALATLGAPILGLIIVRQQPRQRIGWIWLAYGLATGLLALGTAVFFYYDRQFSGYSSLQAFLIWLTQPAKVATFVCTILLLLWFPDGQLLSRKWRILTFWLSLAVILFAVDWFAAGRNWNGASTQGIIIDNPYGWLPEEVLNLGLSLYAFVSILLILFLAIVSVVLRYRGAEQLVRRQIRWFVFGGLLFSLTFLLPVLTDSMSGRINFVASILGYAAIIPLYVAVGVAILRYQLYDIDVIIRKTAVYAILTALLALVYFGMVLLLQTVFGKVAGEQSPAIIVISTLAIAALFAPLRRRVQEVLDRRFFRKKYDAQQVLAQFAQTARDETDMAMLSGELVRVIQETIQPQGVSIWLKRQNPL